MKWSRELAWYLFWILGCWVGVTVLFTEACVAFSDYVSESNKLVRQEKQDEEWLEFLESLSEEDREKTEEEWLEFLESLGEGEVERWRKFLESRGEE